MDQDSSGAFLYMFTGGVVAGVGYELLLPAGILFTVVGIAVAITLLMCGALFRTSKLFLAAALMLGLVFGMLRADLYASQKQSENVLSYVGRGMEVRGLVVNDPELRATSIHVNIQVETINNIPAQGQLLAMLDVGQEVAYGDTLTLRGSIVEPQPFETNTGHLFDYAGYLEAQGTSALMPHAVVLDEKSGGYSLQKFLFSIKHYFEHSIERLFPEPDGSLLEGILLGERRGIPQSLTQAFISSSLVHVVVLSGHNITIVSEGVFRALAFLPRTASYSVGAVLMVLFALMTGAGATTIRALLMALVALLARYLHRSALALRSLALAASLMVLWNPPSLFHDPSFILSVLATFGLITLAPWVEQKIWRIPNYKRFDLRSIVATTIAVEIFVTPALLYFSGTLSFFALPANILALPAVPFAMLSGFVAGLLGCITPSVAFVPTVLCDLALKWMMLVATTIQSLPYSTVTVAQFPVWIVLAGYVPLTLFAIRAYRNASR